MVSESDGASIKGAMLTGDTDQACAAVYVVLEQPCEEGERQSDEDGTAAVSRSLLRVLLSLDSPGSSKAVCSGSGKVLPGAEEHEKLMKLVAVGG